MNTTIDCTELLALAPGHAAQEGPIDDDDGEWRDFLRSGLRVDPAVLGEAQTWRHAPVLLSY